MPAWITSELRLEVWLPISFSASTIKVLCCGRARRAAQARPRAPAPIIRVSILSMACSVLGFGGFGCRSLSRLALGL
ncbi:hypothetical protein D9M68_628500 [compost metagenome]